MSRPAVTRATAAFLAALLLLAAGCGGGNGGADDGANEGRQGQAAVEEQTTPVETGPAIRTTPGLGAGGEAYRRAQKTCSETPLEELADRFGVEPEPEAVAGAVAEEEDGAQAQDRARLGCIEGLRQNR